MHGSQSRPAKLVSPGATTLLTLLPGLSPSLPGPVCAVHVPTSSRGGTGWSFVMFSQHPSHLLFPSCQTPHLAANGEWVLGGMGHYAGAQYES